jgi:hypothetical protein
MLLEIYAAIGMTPDGAPVQPEEYHRIDEPPSNKNSESKKGSREWGTPYSRC